jgi:hypothetical protein
MIMKVRKNLEGVFIAAAILTTFASYATAAIGTQRATAAIKVEAVQLVDDKVAVVEVKAKRLTAEEKAALN